MRGLFVHQSMLILSQKIEKSQEKADVSTGNYFRLKIQRAGVLFFRPFYSILRPIWQKVSCVCILNTRNVSKPIPPSLRGIVHTIELELYEYEGADLSLCLEVPNLGLNHAFDLVAINEKGRRKRVRFNPNSIKIKPLYGFEHQRIGDITALQDLENALRHVSMRISVPRDKLHTVRLDFAIDCIDTAKERLYARVMEAIITAFMVKHNLKIADQSRTTGQINRELKAVRATYRQLSMLLYNRQHRYGKTTPVKWRLEVRYGEQQKYRPKQPKTPVEMITIIRNELQGLRGCLPLLEARMNQALYDEYQTYLKKQLIPVNRSTLYEFLRSRASQIFTRRQLEKLLLLLVPNEKQAYKKADNQITRHPNYYEVINEESYKRVLRECDEVIGKYLINEGSIDCLDNERKVCNPLTIKDLVNVDHKAESQKTVSRDYTLASLALTPQNTLAPDDEEDDYYKRARAWRDEQEELELEYLRIQAETMPPDYQPPCSNHREPWPPFGQPALAIGRTPPAWVTESMTMSPCNHTAPKKNNCSFESM